MQSKTHYAGTFVSALCHDGAGNFLLDHRGGQARDRHGEWEFGGGAVEAGESLEAAVRRETKEEFGVVLSEVHQLTTREFIRASGAWKGVFYVARVNPQEVYIAEPVYDQFAWFTLENLPSPLFEDAREIAQLAVDYLN